MSARTRTFQLERYLVMKAIATRDRSDNQVEFLGHLSMLSLYAIVDMGYTESAML